MENPEIGHGQQTSYPVQVSVERALEPRDRITTAFRIILAIPHLILVGGPLAATLPLTAQRETESSYNWGSGAGAFGVLVGAISIIAWFAIVFTGRYPDGLWNIAALYMRWRVRAVAYTALLRDEYPPFGDGPYPAVLELPRPDAPRDRASVAFRIFLIIPQLIAIWVIGIAWGFTSIIAWFSILFTGRFPESLYDFGVGALRWSTRVEAYGLLLRDEYPPFSLH